MKKKEKTKKCLSSYQTITCTHAHTQSEMANDLPKFFFRSVFIFFIIFPLFLVGSKEKESKIKMVTAPDFNTGQQQLIVAVT